MLQNRRTCASQRRRACRVSPAIRSMRKPKRSRPVASVIDSTTTSTSCSAAKTGKSHRPVMGVGQRSGDAQPDDDRVRPGEAFGQWSADQGPGRRRRRQRRGARRRPRVRASMSSASCGTIRGKRAVQRCLPSVTSSMIAAARRLPGSGSVERREPPARGRSLALVQEPRHGAVQRHQLMGLDEADEIALPRRPGARRLVVESTSPVCGIRIAGSAP